MPLLVLEDGLAARARRVRRVLALAVPRERLVEAREQVGPATAQLVVRGDQAHEAAQPALHRRLEAEEAHECRRLPEPAPVGVEGLPEVGDGAAHPVAQRLAGILDVVEARAVGLLRDHLAEHRGQQPADGQVLGVAVALDREAIHHREAGIRLELGPHRGHEGGARAEREVGGIQRIHRTGRRAHRGGDRVELGHAVGGQRDQPPLRCRCSRAVQDFLTSTSSGASCTDT